MLYPDNYQGELPDPSKTGGAKIINVENVAKNEN